MAGAPAPSSQRPHPSSVAPSTSTRTVQGKGRPLMTSVQGRSRAVTVMRWAPVAARQTRELSVCTTASGAEVAKRTVP